LLRLKALNRALATILLLAVFAVLVQGVLHEVGHDSDHEGCTTTAEAITAQGHSDHCHSEHQSCSSLSCTHGTLFLAESAFCWQTDGQNELLEFPDDVYRLPIIAANFFKPPRASLS